MPEQNNNKEMQDTTTSQLPQETMNRRDFSRTMLTGGVLSALGLITIPEQAEAWLDGNFQNRDDLGDALRLGRGRE